MFEKNLEIAFLLDFYGDILTQRKKDALDFYYNDDMSLSEIAEEMSISRQGVRDIIKKAEEELFFYEEKLGLARKFKNAQSHAKKALALCEAEEVSDTVKNEIRKLIESVG
ncbi:MAG: DNA-binding protein [Ruminococcaceae bacterium]|nr:DNA-binding protein [Oscillospiraceae bacterium]